MGSGITWTWVGSLAHHFLAGAAFQSPRVLMCMVSLVTTGARAIGGMAGVNPTWEDVMGKRVGFHTPSACPIPPHQPALSSREGAELALGMAPSLRPSWEPLFREKLRVRGDCHLAMMLLLFSFLATPWHVNFVVVIITTPLY